MDKLKGRVAFVTGATSGIGEATAKAFAKEGAKVAIVGRDQEAGNSIVQSIKQKNGTAVFIEMDVTNADEVKKAVQKTAQELGEIDILFNSAGIHDEYKDISETSEEEFDKILAVNLKGVFLVTREVIPMMVKKGKGAVVTVGSQGSFVAGPGGISYVSSKHALVGFNKQLAYDFGEKGVRANLLAPGFIDTPMTEGFHEPVLDKLPAKRAGKPEEIASVAVFLASDDASYMQGSELTIDGGWRIGRK